MFGRPYVHWYDADGAVLAVRFGDGTAEAAVHYVETSELRQERHAGRAIFGSGYTHAQNLLGGVGGRPKLPANFNVLVWRRRVLALGDGAPLVEIEPRTLAARGVTDLGVVGRGVGPHWRRHPRTGETYLFGQTFGERTELHVYALPREGAPRRHATVVLPGPRVLLHDFALADRHLVFFVPPIEAPVAPILLGLKAAGEGAEWKPELGTEVVVVPLDGAPPFTFAAPPFHYAHCGNAFEVGDGVVAVDVCRYRSYEPQAALTVEALRSGDAWHRSGVAGLDRIHVDVRASAVQHEWLFAGACDHPEVHPALRGRRQRHTYVIAEAPDGERVARVDHDAGSVVAVDLGAARFAGEVTFVPRGEGELEGWLLTVVYDADRHVSGVAVLDARELEAGPLAIAWLEQHVPPPMHGVWTT